MGNFSSGKYWADRSDLLYYRYIDYIVRTVGSTAHSMLDVGSGNCPYLEWFDWIESKYSVDLQTPYESNSIIGVVGDIHSTNFPLHFDIVSCLQVLEHVPDAKRFAKRLLELGSTLIISVPYKWPGGKAKDHVHDPVDEEKLFSWFGRRPNYQIVVREPFLWACHERIICIYDSDETRKYGMIDRNQIIIRSMSVVG